MTKSPLALLLVLLPWLGSACSEDRRGIDKTDGMVGDGFGHDLSGPCQVCSNDLHQVLNCEGSVIATCPEGQGCSPTQGCVPACDAAAENRSSIGCEYFVHTPPPLDTGVTCFAAFVANNWGEPVTIGVERAQTSLDVSTFAVLPSGSGMSVSYAPLTGGVVPPDGVAIVFLSSANHDCPGDRAAARDVGYFGTKIGDAFRIVSSAPVVIYDMYPYGGGAAATTSATLLLPTSSWDTSFIAASIAKTWSGANPWIGFIASEDNTQILLKPTAQVSGGTGIAGGPPGAPITYTLDRGRFLQLDQEGDLSGSAVVADKPIALFGGNALAHVPSTAVAADGFHQQMPPAHALASRYVAARYRNRIDNIEETPPWTVIGVIDGTVLTYDPPQAGAPTALSAGQVVRFDAKGPFIVSSQDNKHPFYVGQYMTGCSMIGGNASPLGCAGDPEWVNVVAPAQFMRRYAFFTDPTYPTTSLVVTRERLPNGTFSQVTLDCAGVITGWKPVGSTGEYEYTTVDLVKGNFTKQGSCDNGQHLAQSDAPFSVTVWGWGTNESTVFSEAVSYAYPAGQALRLINDVAVNVQ